MAKKTISYNYSSAQGPQMKGRASRLVEGHTVTRTSREFKGGRFITTKTKTFTDFLGSHIETSENKGFNVFGLVFLILLLVAVSAFLVGDEPKTFASFLEMLTTVPRIDMPWKTISDFVLNFPDWLVWLEPVVGFFQQLLSIGVFLFGGILQVMSIVVWVMKWLFL